MRGEGRLLKILSKYSKKKAAALLIAAILLLTAVVGGALALLLDTSDAVTNTFTPAHVTCAVTETVADNVKSSVKIKNTGDIDAYIRVAAVGNTVDANGNVTGNFDLSTYLAASGWTKSGNYYYWNAKVAPNALTGELLTGNISLDGHLVTILAEAIQADGMPGVTDAVGAFAYAAANGTTGGGA